jgi:tetratricopeptide (TPR) repeat protein
MRVDETETGGLHVNLMALVSKAHGLDAERAQELQARFLEGINAPEASVETAINIASQLSLSGAYREAIAAYEQISERFPNRSATCKNNIGAAYFFLGEYETALRYYVEAGEAGEHAQRIEYNIWEACAELVKLAQAAANDAEVTRWKAFYSEHYPHGEYSF